jgi:hypothetical protein
MLCLAVQGFGATSFFGNNGWGAFSDGNAPDDAGTQEPNQGIAASVRQRSSTEVGQLDMLVKQTPHGLARFCSLQATPQLRRQGKTRKGSKRLSNGRRQRDCA